MKIIYDVTIIGGGPAGMMAAGRAASLGKSVILIEKNPYLGKKLLITGGGRCNVTNINSDLRKIYKESGKILSSAFSQFSFEDGLRFFNENGMETKIEPGGRVFPKSNKAESVLNILLDYIDRGNVVVKTDTKVYSIIKENDLFKITLNNSEVVRSKSCIVATGGLSHPETGSTGDGFIWLKKLGHNIVKNDFALVPIALSENWVKELSGATFDDVKITVMLDGQKSFSKRGRILFTHFGISGPTILNMSKQIGNLLQTGEVKIILDIFPTQDIGSLRTRLNTVLNKESNKMLKNSLNNIIPKSLIPIILKVGKIYGDMYNNSVNREIRYKIIDILKNLPVTVESLMGSDKAIISSGGVNLSEVELKTMESKLVKNLYIIGDLLNIDRPSGGYSLQLCWTTGYVAGTYC